MKVFSLDRFIEERRQSGKSEEVIQKSVDLWGKYCDGQPVNGGSVVGTNGEKYFSCREWEIEKE